MKWKGFLLLVALFGVLYALRTRHEEAVSVDRLHVYDHALLPAFEPERVQSIHVDQIERNWQMRLERDQAGSWFLIDPVAYPANDELVAKLLTVLRRERGTLNAVGELSELSLEPPRAVIELQEKSEDGVVRRRIELGAFDVDPLRMNVHVPGHPASPEGRAGAVLRVSRAVHNTLARNPDDFRETRVTPFVSPQVQHFRRWGKDPEMDFAAVRAGAAWRTDTDPSIRLDPGAFGVLLRCAAELRSRAFVDDKPGAMERYGFGDPDLAYSLTASSGEKVELRLLRRKAGDWIAMRADLPNVFLLETTDVELLQRPADPLYDLSLVRLLRERVQRVTLERAGASSLVVQRENSGWSVREGSVSFPASSSAVDDLLAGFDKLRIAAFVPEVSFPDGQAVGSFLIETDDGDAQGGSLGPDWSDATMGLAGSLFRRRGEAATGLIDGELAQLLNVSIDALRPKLVHSIKERFVDRVRFRLGNDEQVFVRMGGDWRPHGLKLEAPVEFLELLDPLLALRVEDWLPDDGGLLKPAVEVRLSGSFGAPLNLELGRWEDGSAGCRLEDGPAARVKPQLVDKVLALFESS